MTPLGGSLHAAQLGYRIANSPSQLYSNISEMVLHVMSIGLQSRLHGNKRLL
jgi:hypothetical protein